MLFGVIGWVGAGLSRLFVGDKIPREPAPTNFGYCARTLINNLLFPLFPPLQILQLLLYLFRH